MLFIPFLLKVKIVSSETFSRFVMWGQRRCKKDLNPGAFCLRPLFMLECATLLYGVSGISNWVRARHVKTFPYFSCVHLIWFYVSLWQFRTLQGRKIVLKKKKKEHQFRCYLKKYMTVLKQYYFHSLQITASLKQKNKYYTVFVVGASKLVFKLPQEELL